MSGFYLMHRGWRDNPLFGREPYSRSDAWIWMIEQAAYAERAINISGRTVMLQRGQLSSSLRYMAKAWGWDEAKVRRFLSRAKNENMIDAATDAGQTIITICNYDRYQAPKKANDAPGDAVKTQQRRGGDAKIKKENKGMKEKGDKPLSNAGADAFVLPPHIPADAWKGFVEMRKRIGKAMTEHAMSLAIDKLDRLAADGWPPGDVLNNSTLNSYQGLFPPKDANNGLQRPATRQAPDGRTMGRTEAAARQALADLSGSGSGEVGRTPRPALAVNDHG